MSTVGELEDREAERVDDQHGDRGEEVEVIALLQPERLATQAKQKSETPVGV